MASFQKRGKTWQYTVSNKGDPIRKGGFKTKKEAQVAAAEVEAELSKGIIRKKENIPFGEYFKEWYNLYKKDIVKNTLRHYDYSLKIINDYFGFTTIQEITKREYQMFLNEFGKTKAKETVDKVHFHIRACVKDAIDEDVIIKDFTRNAVITFNNPGKKPHEKHLNYKDSIKLLNFIYEKLDEGLGYYVILLGLTSGMRFAEIVGLTRKDFNFKNNTITINKTWGHMNGMHEGFGPTKNESSERTIKMDKRTMRKFKELFIAMPDNINQLVFFSPSSKYKVVSNAGVNKLLKKALLKLSINTVTFHGLRHTHVSILIYKREVTINYISERIGHSDVETTLKKYSHLLKELKKEDEQITMNIFESMYV